MARKDNMLRAFLRHEEFCDEYNIEKINETSIYEAQKSELVVLVALAKIIDKYDVDNTTPIYQQVINLLNERL